MLRLLDGILQSDGRQQILALFDILAHGQAHYHGLAAQNPQKSLAAFIQNVDLDIRKGDPQLFKALGNGLFHGFGAGFHRPHFNVPSPAVSTWFSSIFSNILFITRPCTHANTLLTTQ